MPSIDNEGITCTSRPACIDCGSGGNLLHAEMRDRLFGSPGTWAIRRCTNAKCGLAWLDPQPDPDQLIKLYARYHTHDDDGFMPDRAVNLSDWRSSRRMKRVKSVLARLAPFWRARFDSDLLFVGSGPPGRVLEAGCGAGRFMRVLRAAGWTAIGLDFDEAAVAAAREKGLDARIGDLAHSDFPDGSFDAITMGNVIEHLPDPDRVFAESRRLLRPGGRLVMITPNIDSTLHRVFGSDWRGLETPRHLYLYSARSIARFAKRAGFRHVEAFTQGRDAFGTQFMVDQSQALARTAGRPVPDPDARRIDRQATLLKWLGLSRGEWIVLVAEA